jgi:dTMP kinase
VSAPAAGRFITLEGGEGAGKSTQARLLADALVGRGLHVLRTREPGGAPGAEHLRTLLLSGTFDWSARAETLLHFAARAEHVEKTIRPALQAGTWVVCDRFYDSTMAYQGYGQGADRGFITALSTLIGLVPDRTIVLDVSAAVARARLGKRGDQADRYDRLGQAFHARVADGFRAIAAAEPARCVLVDADGNEATVHAAALAALGPLLH